MAFRLFLTIAEIIVEIKACIIKLMHPVCTCPEQTSCNVEKDWLSADQNGLMVEGRAGCIKIRHELHVHDVYAGYVDCAVFCLKRQPLESEII